MSTGGNVLLVRRSIIAAVSLAVGFPALAQISDAFRKDNAVVLYEFNEASGPFLDTANPKWGAPLNLNIAYPASVKRTTNYAEVEAANMIMSPGPATKLISECKKTNAMTLEMTFENSSSVEIRTGRDAAGDLQPMRIISLGNGLFDRNFMFGQIYDGGDFFHAVIAGNTFSSIKDPLITNPKSARIAFSGPQTIILSKSAEGVANLYMSDKSGNLYLSKTDEVNFKDNFSKWSDAARLSLANEVQPGTAYNIADSLPQGVTKPAGNLMMPAFTNITCNTTASLEEDPICRYSPKRYWTGRLYRVAVYCQSLTTKQVLGEKGTEQKQEVVTQFNSGPITAARKEAANIYSRLTSIKAPIDHPKVVEMESKIAAGDKMGAAAIATTESNFYNITVRDFAAKMSNREETISVPLNDFIATYVGGIRDDLNAKDFLSRNITYQSKSGYASVPQDLAEDILKSNNHYEALDNGKYDLAKVLEAKPQMLISAAGIADNPTPAGVLTSRAFMSAHAVAGTNRRLVEFAFREFLCAPIASWADATGPDSYIGKDVDRFPGGEHSKFTSNCRSCHSGMDAFRGAFARYTFSAGFIKNSLLTNPLMGDDEDNSVNMKISDAPNAQLVAYKMNHNQQVFESGKTVVNDAWENFANRGSNVAFFGWKGAMAGKGVTEFGKMLSESKAYPRCMVQKVYRSVCKRDVTALEANLVNTVTDEFVANNYNFKFLFQRIAIANECIGGGQ